MTGVGARSPVRWKGLGSGSGLGDRGSGVKARLFHEVCEAHLANSIRVDLKPELFTYDIDQQAQQRAEVMDGKLLLVTNVADLETRQIVLI